MFAISMDVMPKIKWLGYVSYKSPWMHFKRISEEFIIYFIKSGELHLRENECRYILRKGDFFVLQPFMEHEGFHQASCDYYYIHFEHPSIVQLHEVDISEITHKIYR